MAELASEAPQRHSVFLVTKPNMSRPFEVHRRKHSPVAPLGSTFHLKNGRPPRHGFDWLAPWAIHFSSLSSPTGSSSPSWGSKHPMRSYSRFTSPENAVFGAFGMSAGSSTGEGCIAAWKLPCPADTLAVKLEPEKLPRRRRLEPFVRRRRAVLGAAVGRERRRRWRRVGGGGGGGGGGGVAVRRRRRPSAGRGSGLGTGLVRLRRGAVGSGAGRGSGRGSGRGPGRGTGLVPPPPPPDPLQLAGIEAIISAFLLAQFFPLGPPLMEHRNLAGSQPPAQLAPVAERSK